MLIERRADGWWYEAGTEVRHICPAEAGPRSAEDAEPEHSDPAAEDAPAEDVWRGLVDGDQAEAGAPRWLRWLRRLIDPGRAEPEAA